MQKIYNARRKMKKWIKKEIWNYRNAWPYSFWGWLNPKCHKHFWFNMIYSQNGHHVKGKPVNWKGYLNDFIRDIGLKRYLCKKRGWKNSLPRLNKCERS